MLTNKVYRKVHQRTEIINYLKSAHGEKLMLWQNLGDKRCVYYSSGVLFNQQHYVLIIDIDNSIGFVSTKPIYIRFHNGRMFKTSPLKISDEKIIVKAPLDFLAYENRAESRLHFDLKDYKSLSLSFFSDLLTNASREKGFQIIDLSKNGVCISASNDQVLLFNRMAKVQLSKILDIQLSRNITCQFIYFKKMRYKLKGNIFTSNRVGLSFSEPLDDYILLLAG